MFLKFTNNLYLINIYTSNYNNSTSLYHNWLYNNFYSYDSTQVYYFKILNFINILLKKEKRYTKLKYSRVPQVDIVSGGVSSLFAGLLGFLVTEKVGFELIDSGDFYVLVVYLAIILNSLRILYKTIVL